MTSVPRGIGDTKERGTGLSSQEGDPAASVRRLGMWSWNVRLAFVGGLAFSHIAMWLSISRSASSGLSRSEVTVEVAAEAAVMEAVVMAVVLSAVGAVVVAAAVVVTGAATRVVMAGGGSRLRSRLSSLVRRSTRRQKVELSGVIVPVSGDESSDVGIVAEGVLI